MKCETSLKLVVTLAILTSAASLVGCASMSGAESRKNLAQLKYGMEESKVLAVLGTPDAVIADSKVDDRWIYEFKKEDKRGHNIFIQFHDGALIRTGELSGRDIAAANENSKDGTCTHIMQKEMRDESLCIK